MSTRLYNTGLKRIQEDFTRELKVLNVPVIEIEIIPPINGQEVGNCLLENPILVFQSKNGVAGFSRWLDSEKDICRDFSTVYATGDQTARAVLQYFNRTAVTPEVQNAAGLLDALRKIKKQPLLLVSGTFYRPDVKDGLTSDGWKVTHAMVYNTFPSVNRDLRTSFTNSLDEVVFFTSPLTVEGFIRTTGIKDLGELNSRILTIGPTTSKWVRKRSGTVFLEAPVPDIPAAVKAMIRKLKYKLEDLE